MASVITSEVHADTSGAKSAFDHLLREYFARARVNEVQAIKDERRSASFIHDPIILGAATSARGDLSAETG